MSVARATVAEAIGTALLLAIVVGSGIMGEKLAAGNTAVALLANSIATGTGLYVLITVFGPISGAHFNPVVSCVCAWRKTLNARACGSYILAQVVGAFVGVLAAHAMFGLPLLQVSAHMRHTPGEGLGEIIATFGLVLVILLTVQYRREAVPIVVACFITSAYWFTASTSFAKSVPLFLGGQIIGGIAAVWLVRWLIVRTATE